MVDDFDCSARIRAGEQRAQAQAVGARDFYLKLGYREAGKRPAYYCGREDALVMTHDLSV